MQYLIASLLGIIGLTIKKSKVVFGVLFIFMWILFGWNTGNADYFGYEQTYYSLESYNGFNVYFAEYEIGYRFVYKLAHAFGMNYNTFLIVYSLIGLMLISNTILKYSAKPSYVMALYLIYPFLMDIVQIRNFMSMAIIIFAARYLFSSRKGDLFRYVLFVLLAASFQVVGLFYLILLLAKVRARIKLVKWISLITIFLVLFLILLMSGIAIPILGGMAYLGTKTSITTQIGYLFYFIIGFLLVRFSYKKVRTLEDSSSSGKHVVDYSKMNMANIILNINIIILCVYPLVFFSTEFMRLYRNILLLNYILFSHIVVSGFASRLNMTVFKITTIIFVVLSEWLFAYYASKDIVFYPIFEKNKIFDLLGL
ncbi:EpsG family protein [Paenibacillus hemerocallicola]|nr:EpsG family protein [Paenibacillus hemerocallicola]